MTHLAELRKRYEEGVRLHAEGRLMEALAVFEEIHVALPEDSDILYAWAYCLASAKRMEDAIRICNRLILDYQDPRGVELRAHLATYARRTPQWAEPQHEEELAFSDSQVEHGETDESTEIDVARVLDEVSIEPRSEEPFLLLPDEEEFAGEMAPSPENAIMELPSRTDDECILESAPDSNGAQDTPHEHEEEQPSHVHPIEPTALSGMEHEEESITEPADNSEPAPATSIPEGELPCHHPPAVDPCPIEIEPTMESSVDDAQPSQHPDGEESSAQAHDAFMEARDESTPEQEDMIESPPGAPILEEPMVETQSHPLEEDASNQADDGASLETGDESTPAPESILATPFETPFQETVEPGEEAPPRESYESPSQEGIESLPVILAMRILDVETPSTDADTIPDESDTLKKSLMDGSTPEEQPADAVGDEPEFVPDENEPATGKAGDDDDVDLAGTVSISEDMRMAEVMAEIVIAAPSRALVCAGEASDVLPSTRRSLAPWVWVALLSSVMLGFAAFLFWNGMRSGGASNIPQTTRFTPMGSSTATTPKNTFPSRTLTFPRDIVLGLLYTRPWNTPLNTPWEELAPASGQAAIPADVQLRLVIQEQHWLDLERIAQMDLLNLTSLRISHSELTDTMLEPLPELRGLRDLALDHTYQVTDRGLQHIGRCMGLRRLTLHATNLATDRGLALLRTLPRLESLDLSDSPFTNAAMPFIIAPTQLRVLRLPDRVTDVALPRLVILRELEAISTGAGVQGDGIQDLARMRRLRRIEFRGDANSAAIRALSGMASLREVCFFGDTPTEGMASVTSLAGLRYLAFVNTPVTRDLAASLASAAGLETLILDGVQEVNILASTEPGDVESSLTQSLGHLLQLRQLTIKAFFITDAILPTLAGLPSLSHLTLDTCRITSEGVAALGSLQTLEFLSLRDTALTAGDIQILAGRLPGCQILSDSGAPAYRSIIFPPAPPMGDVYLTPSLSVQGAPEELTGRASGAIRVMADKSVLLVSSFDGERDLSSLAQLRPDDIQAIRMPNGEATDANLANLSHLSGLRALHVRGVYINDAGVQHLLPLSGLEILELPGAKITDKALGQIARAMPRLSHLALDDCSGITKRAVTSLSQMKGLRTLSLTGTPLTQDNLRRLSEALPECEITPTLEILEKLQ